MGHLEGTRGHTPFFKMDMKILLSLVVGVITLTQPASTSEPRVVCYYTNWSVYRPGTARFNPQNINPYLCTHLIYAFGGFTKDNTLKPFDKYQDIEKGGYAKFTGLKTYNKNLKTLLAIGGWNEGSSRFSPMVASRERRKEFVRNVIKFLRQNRFDGLDLDWEYPAFRDGGKPKDRENYAKLVRELREEFDRESEKTGKPRLLLTMAVPAGIEYIQKGFDVKTLNQYLDWMNLLTYDYHSAFEPAVNHHAPLYPLEEPNEYSVDTELNIDYTIKFYLENGADADKLVLGIPTYGRSYTLFNADAVEIGSPADGPGEQGDATREKGYLAYYEICEALKPKEKKRSIDDSSEYSEEEEEEWTVMHPNPRAMGPVAYKGNQWVGYDDLDIVKKKAEYVAENGLGGIMFWSIDNDDFRGNCHDKPYPLIEAAKEAYMARIGSSDNAVSTARPKPASRPSSRRNRPKASTTTTERSTTKTPKRASSSTPTWSTTPAPPSTPDPGADFKCTDEGFFPHPRDCKKYFWCLDSGPSNLGIVAHQFTCPSGLFFNKAADSCDFARNVLCKLAAPAAPPAPAPRTPPPPTAAPTTAAPTTTRRPLRLSTKNSALFRTTTTTTTSAPESEEYDESGIEEHAEEDAEDPRVIKELIGLIKKLGGVDQLEKHLYLSEAPSTASGSTTTPASFNKKLYQKVLERTRGKNKYTGKSFQQSRPSSSEGQEAQNSRPGPQNQGLEPSKDKDVLLKKDRPQYTTINRQRLPVPIFEEEEEESEEVSQPFKNSRGRVTEEDDTTTARPLQYVNIRRARPTDAADDSASRNALFERAESDGSALEPNAVEARGRPPYVPIRRARPTAPPPYQDEETESETELQATALEREISSQPQYTSVVRARATTLAPPPDTTPAAPDTTPAAPDPAPAAPEPEPTSDLVLEPTTPEPTTILAVQISSLLNSLSFEELINTTVAQTTEAAPAPASSPAPAPRRRGSTSTTPAPATSTTQVSSRTYTFVRRGRPQKPNEISNSDNDVMTARRIRSTTPDSREVDTPRRVVQRFRSRFQSAQTDDSVSAAASPVSRGQFRPRLLPEDENAVNITAGEEKPQSEPKSSFASRYNTRYRGRTTAANKVADSEASAATVEARPSVLPRGRSRFFSPATDATELPEVETTETTFLNRRPTFARFSPRPFARQTSPKDDENINDTTEISSVRTPTRLPFIKSNTASSTSAPTSPRARKFLSRYSTAAPSNDEDDEPENKNDDISLSESAIEEKEHDEEPQTAPKRRVIIKKIRASTTEVVPTEAVPIQDLGKVKFRIVRKRPLPTVATTEEVFFISTIPPKIRKVIRKKISKPFEGEPEIRAKSIGSLDYSQTSTTETSFDGPVNYGERRRPITTLPTTIEQSTEFIPTTTESVPTTQVEEILEDIEMKVEKETDYIKTREEIVPDFILDTSSNDTVKSTVAEDEYKVTRKESGPKFDIFDYGAVDEIHPEAEVVEFIEQETTPSTTTLTTTTSRSRLPYRPRKRLFTSTTEAIPSSSRTFSRKFNPGVYTSPATVSTRNPPLFSRRPSFSSQFVRKPFALSKPTFIKPEEVSEEDEEEYNSEEEKSHEFDSQEMFEENLEEEVEAEDNPRVTTKSPFRPRVINSNTFRTSTSTTELPKRFGTPENKTVYNRFSSIKPVNDTKKRVQNVPAGYIAPVDNQPEDEKNREEDVTTTENATDGTTDDDYLSMDTTTTISDTTNTDSSTSFETEGTTTNSSDDYLENTEQTTNYPTTQEVTTNAETTYYYTARNTETTQTTTTTTPAPPIIKTQYDKLFSVSRVVEVSSKLDKHRVNKNNETTHIEEGRLMVEKKPEESKVGEVSRFSFIKIVEDDIPIYLTKLGHFYPVANPPDHLIRIDEARNARALTNSDLFPKENLVASESINEAYRHVQKAPDAAKDEMDHVERITGDDFLSYVNEDKKDKSNDPLFAQWQFVPAAYENEKNKAGTFDIVTPRSMNMNPSTLPLESLFRTDIPTARKASGDEPFVVYSAPVPTQKEEAKLVKIEILPPETGRSIVTFAKGQEIQGASMTEKTSQSPISISILPKEEPTSTTTTTTEFKMTSIVEMLSTPKPVTESTTVSTEAPTSETQPIETTTVKLSPVDAKRAKYGFPRRPIIRVSNTTRLNVTKAERKVIPTVTNNLLKKSNKTSAFSPNKTIFVSRAQNVPVDVRKKISTKITSKTPKVFTTEAPRTTTERKPYIKPLRPVFRPAFVPKRSTTTESSLT